jgi:ribosomal protein S18 acetylase RimI-like enzyme
MARVHDVRIAEAAWPEDRGVVEELFREYVGSLVEDIGFQDVDGELAGLPGAYAPPAGAVLIGRDGSEPAGICAYRRCAPGRCEMKRLYVRPAFRARRLGRRLAQALIARARAQGYQTMVLDTLASMRSARALYAALGFRPIPPYYDNPLPGTAYMALDL